MLKRFIKDNVLLAAKDTPVVMVNGARQTGKSTLLSEIAKELPNLEIKTFDELTTRSAAQRNPQAFLESLSIPVVLDEVQHVPDIFQAIKYLVDQNRQPGQFF